MKWNDILRRFYNKKPVPSVPHLLDAIKVARANVGNQGKQTRFLPVSFSKEKTEFLRIDKAPTTMRGKRVATDTAYLRQWNRADWTGTDPRIQLFAGLLIEAARKQQIPLYVHCALRTDREQARLHMLGRSKIKGPKAAHTVGCAVDIVHSDDHWELTKNEWAWIGITGQSIAERVKLPIEWGGNWRFYDPAHWQLADWKEKEVVRTDLAHMPLHQTPRVLVRHNQHLLA